MTTESTRKYIVGTICPHIPNLKPFLTRLGGDCSAHPSKGSGFQGARLVILVGRSEKYHLFAGLSN